MRGLILWTPMLQGDSVAAATTQAESWQDDRVRHWWDDANHVGSLFSRALGLHGPAWDVYLLYRGGARWDGELPPAPVFWMHQLWDPGANPDLRLPLDPSRLGHELDALLKE